MNSSLPFTNLLGQVCLLASQMNLGLDLRVCFQVFLSTWLSPQASLGHTTGRHSHIPTQLLWIDKLEKRQEVRIHRYHYLDNKSV